MNCTGFLTTFVYDWPQGLLSTEAKDVAGGSEDDRFTEYKYGDSNGKTQQTKKTVKLYTDGSGGPLEQTAYDYNLQGRMSVVEIDSDGNGDLESRLEYEYNDHGIRTAHTETTDTDEDGELGDETPQRTDYLVDEHNPTGYAQVLEEWIDGALAKTYTIAHDVFAEAVAAGVVRRLLKDGHGSTRMLVDAAGLPLSGQLYRFDAYGNAIGFDPALALTTLLYNSEQFDWRTGLSYLRARYYDPASGRFNRLDPFRGNMQDPQSLHKYLYCAADPLSGVDPSGLLTLSSTLSAIKTSMVVGAIAGSAYGYVRNGWQGALQYGLLGTAAGPIVTVAVMWSGFTLSLVLPISEATGIFLAGSLAAEISAKHALNAWASAQTEQERRAASFALILTGIGWTVGAAAYVQNQWAAGQQLNASQIPKAYMGPQNNLNMLNAPGGATNALGYPVNAKWYFRELYQTRPEMFSTANVNRIYGPNGSFRVPVVDETWVQYNATHRSWMNSKLEHHHIDQGPTATAIPEPVHDAWSTVLHSKK